MSQNKEDMHMGEALAYAYFLDHTGGRVHTRVSAVISTSQPRFDKNDRLVITCNHTRMNGLSIIRVIIDKDFQVIKANKGEIRYAFLCSYVPSFVRLPGFSKQDTSRIRWRKRRFN